MEDYLSKQTETIVEHELPSKNMNSSDEEEINSTTTNTTKHHRNDQQHDDVDDELCWLTVQNHTSQQ